VPSHTIAIIGGTGPEGLGLALRFAKAGEAIIIGSRSAERAQEAVATIRAKLPHAQVRGMTNAEAAAQASMILVTVPFEGQKDTLTPLAAQTAGKIVINAVVPLQFVKGKGMKALLVEEGSAAQQAQALLPQAKVIAAFQNLSAKELAEIDHELPSDVVVCGDDKEAKATVIALAGKIQGVRGVDGGGLDNARYVEDLTALLLNINRIYKTQSTIKLVGL